ncbi:hypothetical protein N7520_008735 [Penicillium odoratum]|uniref:uncharacterized protein n=1 Tax=Penicillium odoratum TaxID=1167516 RepID=UPI002547F789|nr:uncharacterized protein N7520_008735 [Penicillium odoratum]KAJ5751818.1 hypothetical protein N7520_008735 [Penicillium odoratum]
MSAKACVIAFAIFTYLVPFGIRLCSTSKFNGYTALLQQVLPAITEAATIDGFQACILLMLTQFFTGKLKSAAVTNSIAAHFVFYLRAHNDWATESFIERQPNILEHTRTHLRNLFWACYTIDKDLCFRVLQPPALGDNYCDLNLSLQYLDKISKDFAMDLPFERFHPSIMFPADIKLSQIKSRAYECLHSIAAFKKPNTELLMDIRNLDNSLETWRLAVPEKYRPSLSFSYDIEVDPGSTDLRSLILRLDYLYCVTVIHRVSNRCLGTAMSVDGMETVIATSIALAVEASRSTLRYLQTAHHILNEGSYWVIVFYALAASVTITCNILDNPALPSAVHDHELLMKVPRLMSHMSMHNLESEERLHRSQLESFVMELLHAAERATSSMRNETPSTPSSPGSDHIDIDQED